MQKLRIYTPQPLASEQLITLEEQASNHLIRVLRLKEGHNINLFNGMGGEYEACIVTAHRQHTTVSVNQYRPDNRCSALQLELGIALSKGDRFELVIQKATELGVTTITPLFSVRTEVKLEGERLEKRLQRWQQQLISASEQCGRNLLPKLNRPLTVNTWCQENDAHFKAVLHHRTSHKLHELEPLKSASLLVGPEGGLNQDEITWALKNDFQAISLGPRVLRTETAPIAAISLFQYLWGDFG